MRSIPFQSAPLSFHKLLLCLVVLICSNITAFSQQKKQNIPLYMDSSKGVESRVNDLLSRMTLEEKIAQMCQFVGIEHQKQSRQEAQGKNIAINDDAASVYGFSFDSLRNLVRKGKIGSFLHIVTAKEANDMQRLAMQSRLKIPLLLGIDAIHGNAMVSGCTVFPTPMGLSSTWNPELVRQTSVVTANEMRSSGLHWTFTPNLDVARDARWGRVGETFGEDPYLISQMGVAMVKGFQENGKDGTYNVLSCIKHLVGGGQSVNGTNAAPTDISDRTLWEVHLPPYKACIDAGAATAMTAHNELNGIPCHMNGYLMDEVMRKKLGFKGWYISDWMDIERLHIIHHSAANQKEAVYETVKTGMDMHMHGPGFLEPLLELIKEGKISEGRIDESVKRILSDKFKLGIFENPFVNDNIESQVFTAKSQALNLQAARESIILLKNQQILPLNATKKKIFITGPNADNQTILGDWSLLQPDNNVITIVEGIRQEAPAGTSIDYLPSGTVKKIEQANIQEAVDRAKLADVAIVVVGENSLRYDKGHTSGENLDRDDIELFGQQNQLVTELIKTGVPVVVVLVNSRPLAVSKLTENAAALIEAWEPGNAGGKALGEIIFGKVNPSGKLTMSIPRNIGQIPTYYNMKASNYFHKYIMTESGSPYPFGYGLSYTNFKFSDLTLSSDTVESGASVNVSVKVSNTGKMDGDEIVQLYIGDKVSSVTRPIKELKAFKRISLKEGESKTVEFTISPEDFKFYNKDMKWILEPGDFSIMVGSSSRDNDLSTSILKIK